MKNKKFKIQVRQSGPGQTGHGSNFIGAITGDFGNYCLVETVARVIWAEQIGNFNPFFCTYKGKTCLVQSDDGDVSDPFRREESYANSFFIYPPLDNLNKCAKITV